MTIPGRPHARCGGRRLADDRGRITMALAIQGPDVSPIDVVAADIGVARELGVPVSMHIGTGGVAKLGIRALADAGLLASRCSFVHCCYSTDDELRLIADAGAQVVVCPSCELMMGHRPAADSQGPGCWHPPRLRLGCRARQQFGPVRRGQDGAGSHTTAWP